MLKRCDKNKPVLFILLALALIMVSALFFTSTSNADTLNWRANSVAEIRANISRNYNSNSKQYQIQTGDTINTISEAFETDANQVVNENHISQANLIFAGCKLLISHPNLGYQAVRGISGTQVAKDQPTASLVSSFDGIHIEPVTINQK